MAPPDWSSAVEIHPPGWSCPATPFWVAGWITSASGLVPVDVRATLGARVFLGLCGLPRADKEIAARGHAGPPHAGFSFLLQPVPDATELRIQVCDQHGRWTEIFRTAVPGRGLAVVAPAPAFTPEPVLRLLATQHVRPQQDWLSLAREILTAEKAETFDVMPSAPFQGALEQLGDRAGIQYDHLLVTGWVAHRKQRVTQLTAFLDTATPQPLVHGLSRPDAGTLFPDLIDGPNSRFAGYLKIPLSLPRPLALRIFADLADGRRELVFLKRFNPVLTSGHGTELPPFSRWKFFRASRALRRAGWGAVSSEEKISAALAEARHAYAVAAPTRRLPRAASALLTPSATRPLHVVLVTHNLNFEGAPLFLLEYALALVAQPGWSVRVVSAQGGPLHEKFSAAGIAVDVLGAHAAFDARSETEFSASIAQLAQSPAWTDADVIVANTLVSFWAVHVAHQLRRPSLFYVHESVSARRFFALQLEPAAIARVEHAFPLATRVVFIAAAAQLPHAALATRRNFSVLPGWIDAARIRQYAAAHDRAERRRAVGWSDDTVVFANVGSLMPRKGQHVFLEAIRLFLQSSPTAKVVFLLVGAKPGPDPYADILRRTIATQSLDQVQLLEHSPDAYAYFHMADVFVCSSLEEALPRVVMEAAVFGRVIVSTNVNGIPEMLGRDDAWLVPPDDPAQLADAMRAALEAHQRGDDSRARRAQKKISARFDAAVLLPQHTALLCAVAHQPASFPS